MTIESLLGELTDKQNVNLDGSTKLNSRLAKISIDEIEIVCDIHWPFIQLVNNDINFRQDDDNRFTISYLPSGWKIHDYGDALGAGPVHDYRGKNFNPIHNVLPGGQYQVAVELAQYIMAKPWQRVELLDGTKTIISLLWLELNRHGLELEKYQPTDADRQLVTRLAKQQVSAAS